MHDLDNIWNRLGGFRNLIDITPRMVEVPGRQLRQLRTLDHRMPPPATLDSMSRWLTIEFSKAAAKLVGSFGTAVRVSDVLRWNAGGANRDYRSALADRLDAHATPRPLVDDATSDHLHDLDKWMQIVQAMQSSHEEWEQGVLAHVYRSARDSFFAVERGLVNSTVEIQYPTDFLPPPDGSVEPAQGLATPVGEVLRTASERASYISAGEREKLRLAVLCYPDEEIEVEVVPNGETPFMLHSLRIEDLSSPADLMESPIGSVRLDHYGDGSRFSPDPTEFEFRLHMPTAENADCEYLDQCFLVTDVITYVASTEPCED